MRTLLIDTASPEICVAVVEGDTLVDQRRRTLGRAVTDLHPMLQQLLAGQRLELELFDQIAVVDGPGNWTGVNVGVVAAKMLCLTLRTPLTMISRMGALIECAPSSWQSGDAIIAAGRISCFFAQFDCDASNRYKAGRTSKRMSIPEMKRARGSQPGTHLIMLSADMSVIDSYGLDMPPNNFVVRNEQMLATYVKCISSGRDIERLKGDEIHLALPDYAGSDQTIRTSPGSFR